MVLTSIALVVLSGLITTISIAATPSDNYLAVALSDTPLNEITPDRKRLVVELIHQNEMPHTESGSPATPVRSKSSPPSLSDICFPADVDGGWPNRRGID